MSSQVTARSGSLAVFGQSSTSWQAMLSLAMRAWTFLNRRRVKCLLVRLGLASLLLAAAAFKAFELSLRMIAAGSLTADIRSTVLILAETALALWLISGWRAQVSRMAALVTFSAFALYSMRAIVMAEPLCGCFGATMRLSPIAALTIDLGAILMLLLYDLRTPLIALRFLRFVRIRGGLTTTTMLPFVIGIGVVLTLLLAITYVSERQQVVVDPEQWIGTRLPIIDRINIDSDLARGEWRLVFLRTDCEQCRRVLGAEQSSAAPDDQLPHTIRTLWIDVAQPPVTRIRGTHIGNALAIVTNIDWAAPVPYSVGIQNGIVVSATPIK